MTRHEREDLAKLCRQREKLAKNAVLMHMATLKANFEQQLAARYSFNQQEAWAKAAASAEAAVKKANEAVAAESKRLGIPAEFSPSINWSWYDRGENAFKQRREELRRVAHARIEAIARDAKYKVEQFSLDTQTKLLADGLESADAKAFLESMPTPAQLMPPMSLKDIEAEEAEERRRRRRYLGE